MENNSVMVPAPIKNKIPLVTLIFGLLIPVVIVIVSVVIFFPFNLILPTTSNNNNQSNSLVPSTILNNKNKYNQQTIVVRGKLNIDPVVCQKLECPVNDSCCGCPLSRNASLKDPDQTISGKTLGSFQLVDGSGVPLCQRKTNSCDYDCQDWRSGQVYDVRGQFLAQAPPPGWNISLDYYFKTTGKEPVSELDLTSGFTNIINGIKQLYNQITASSSYVIQ